jgi:hypothetical protein
MFSLEGPEGVRFVTRSRVFSGDETAQLREAGRVESEFRIAVPPPCIRSQLKNSKLQTLED